MINQLNKLDRDQEIQSKMETQMEIMETDMQQIIEPIREIELKSSIEQNMKSSLQHQLTSMIVRIQYHMKNAQSIIVPIKQMRYVLYAKIENRIPQSTKGEQIMTIITGLNKQEYIEDILIQFKNLHEIKNFIIESKTVGYNQVNQKIITQVNNDLKLMNIEIPSLASQLTFLCDLLLTIKNLNIQITQQLYDTVNLSCKQARNWLSLDCLNYLDIYEELMFILWTYGDYIIESSFNFQKTVVKQNSQVTINLNYYDSLSFFINRYQFTSYSQIINLFYLLSSVIVIINLILISKIFQNSNLFSIIFQIPET